MLQIQINPPEQWDAEKNEFVYLKGQTLQLEHSLISLSKWESKWCKPFLSRQEKSYEETLDYVKCMTLTQNVDPRIYYFLTNGNIREINAYIEAPMTATTFSPEQKRAGQETITAELIYYWMIASNIPFECQKWHLNRLLTLIKVCSIKNSPPRKIGRKELMRRNTELNMARRKALNSRG